MVFELADLPYDPGALEPYISRQTVMLHHGKHQAAYVNNLNNALSSRGDYEGQSLLSIIRQSSMTAGDEFIFNNASQIYNHELYWRCMKAGGGGKPAQPLLDKINEDFKSYDAFMGEFKGSAIANFGSGWTWLFLDTRSDKLKVLSMPNAESPYMTADYKPLLALDVWEHSYYLDYQNRRPDYVEDFLKNLVNWELASELFES